MVVPTYNERDGVSELTRLVRGVHRTWSSRVVIVTTILRTARARSPTTSSSAVRVIHVRETGTQTVVAGFAAATADIVGVMDAVSHPRLVRGCSRADSDRRRIVVASRACPGRRRTGAFVMAVVALGLSPFWPLRRSRCAQPFSSAAVVHGVSSGRRVQICLELLVRAWPQRLVELPYQFDDRAR